MISINRDEAIEIARETIAQMEAEKEHSYIGLPEFFLPHFWATAAIQAAYHKGYSLGHMAGYAKGWDDRSE